MLHSFLLLALFTERATATTALRAVKTDEELPASTLLVGKRMHPGDADANVITHQCETFHDWRACTETIEGCGWCVTTEGLGKVSCVERQSARVCVCVLNVCVRVRERESVRRGVPGGRPRSNSELSLRCTARTNAVHLIIHRQHTPPPLFSACSAFLGAKQGQGMSTGGAAIGRGPRSGRWSACTATRIDISR